MESRGGGSKGTAGGGPAAPERWLSSPATAAEVELRQALDRASAREADEVALRRVWARLAEKPLLVPVPAESLDAQESFHMRRIRWPWVVAASLAGATAVLAIMVVTGNSQGRGTGTVVAQGGSVDVGELTKKAILLDEHSTLVAPATVRTGAGETLRLALRGGTEVVVGSESTLVLDENDRPAVVRGDVEFHVPPQPSGQTFAVQAGHYRVVVVGTRFHVRMSDENAGVGVQEGVVEIWTDHRLARITAGQSWTSRIGQASAPAIEMAAPAAAAPALVPATTASAAPAARGLHAIRGARFARVAPAGAGTARLGKPTLARTGDARRVLAMATPSSTGTSGSSISGSGTASAAMVIGSPGVSGSGPSEEATLAALGPTPSNTVLAPPAPAPAPMDPAVLANQARTAQAAGNARRALDLYRLLAQRQGAVGENAGYEIGRVLRDGLHQPREAVAAWRDYRTQHPRGLLRIEADISVIETLASVGDKTGALTEASDFIRRYPESERKMEVARLAGDLLRERGDCASAIDAYDVAMGSGRARREIADGVSFHRSACVLRRDHAKGVEALKGYLQSFPSGHFRSDAERLLSEAQSPALAPRP